MPALAVWSPEDGVLGVVAPLALAVAAGTALVVDLDPGGPRYPGAGTLAGLVADGPRAADLVPARRGVAVLRNGGIDPARADEVLTALLAGWPAVVLRAVAPNAFGGVPTVPVVPLLPGGMIGRPAGRVVYQRSGWRVPVPRDGIVLPRPRRGVLEALLVGRLPPPGDPWIRAWRAVWRWSWA